MQWQSPEILHSPFFANGIALQKFPQNSTPSIGQLPTPISPALPGDSSPVAACNCFSAALGVLNELNAYVQEQKNPLELSHHPELLSQSQRGVLNTITDALETCEVSMQCNTTHSSMVSMLYAVVLQQVSTCYENLSSGAGHILQQSLPQKPWLANQRARGQRICHEMEMRLRNTFEEVDDQSELLGRNSVVTILSSVRVKFSEGLQRLR